MKFCSNCGSEINENAVVCVNCGAAVNGAIAQTNTVDTNIAVTTKSGNGAGSASLVLGILGTIFGVIGVIIAACVNSYYTSSWTGRIESYSSNFQATKIGIIIFLAILPAILSITGFLLGIFSKKNNGSKIAGIVLNIIGLVCTIIIFAVVNSI